MRVLKNGAEIPAFVDQATPWRHATNPALNGASVRVARIQFRYTFAVTFPQTETVTVAWGGPPRTQTLPVLQPPRDEWHRVTDGTTATGGPTFGASHDVWEPDVYAVLPVAWLVNSGIKTRLAAFDPAVGPNRLNPATIPASFPGYREADHAQVNFFYTILNEDNPVSSQNAGNTNFFLGGFGEQGEPWLYDRAMAMYMRLLPQRVLPLPARGGAQLRVLPRPALHARGLQQRRLRRQLLLEDAEPLVRPGRRSTPTTSRWPRPTG